MVMWIDHVIQLISEAIKKSEWKSLLPIIVAGSIWNKYKKYITFTPFSVNQCRVQNHTVPVSYINSSFDQYIILIPKPEGAIKWMKCVITVRDIRYLDHVRIRIHFGVDLLLFSFFLLYWEMPSMNCLWNTLKMSVTPDVLTFLLTPNLLPEAAHLVSV